MKKIISVLLITVLCCAFLFSCGNTEDTGKLYLVKQTMTDKTGTVTVEFIYNQETGKYDEEKSYSDVESPYAVVKIQNGRR